MALVIVTHLGPARESLLNEIVGRYTRLPVHTVVDGEPAQKDHVYVLPSDVMLGVEQGNLRIHAQNALQRERKPIDVFFSSLAEDQGELAVCVVLSGGDSDGTLDLKAIKERGGVTMAQTADGFGPQHSSMPDSAIATGLVDYAVPVEAMGAKLAEFAHSAYVLDDAAFSSSAQEELQKLEHAKA